MTPSTGYAPSGTQVDLNQVTPPKTPTAPRFDSFFEDTKMRMIEKGIEQFIANEMVRVRAEVEAIHAEKFANFKQSVLQDQYAQDKILSKLASDMDVFEQRTNPDVAFEKFRDYVNKYLNTLSNRVRAIEGEFA